MNEIKIGKQIYHETTVENEIQVPGGPTLIVRGLKAHICTETGDELMDAATLVKRDQSVVVFLIRKYSNLELPGTVANYVRRLMGLKLSDWATLAKLDQSTLSRAVSKENVIDHYAALVLMSLAADFVTGGKQGRHFIETIQNMGSDISVPNLEAVEVA
jgi:hypothetical protein